MSDLELARNELMWLCRSLEGLSRDYYSAGDLDKAEIVEGMLEAMRGVKHVLYKGFKELEDESENANR